MASWAKEIMKLANDFCICTAQARKIVDETEILSVPKGHDENAYKYDRAHSRLKPIIMATLGE